MKKSNFLLQFGLIICLIILYNLKFVICNNKKIENSKVVIIGAGVAGISAATKLLKNGFKNITILEAEDRIGGRIHTTKFGNYTVDLGCEWKNLEKDNINFDIKYLLNLFETPEKINHEIEQILDSLGNPLNINLLKNHTDFSKNYVSNMNFHDHIIYESTNKYISDKKMKRHVHPGIDLIINKTILNAEVTSIDYLNDAMGPSVLINTANGQLHKADHVIVTLSLGVLKDKYKSLFIPPLPGYKITAIEGIEFASSSKIYFLFDQPFWKFDDRESLHFTFLWHDTDKKIIESESEKLWLLGMHAAIVTKSKPNLLLLLVAGKYARNMEMLSEDKVFNHAVENLHRFFDKMYNNVTAPFAMIRSQWYINSHFRGAYSYSNFQNEKRKIMVEMLEKPLVTDKLKILFAGEATSIDNISTVNGAIQSGWKAANRLIHFYT